MLVGYRFGGTPSYFLLMDIKIVNDIREVWNNLKPFNNIDDIPTIPVLDKASYEEIVVKNLIRCGAIPIDKLEVGATYEGVCRNSSKATWDGNEFYYDRHKFGTVFVDHVNHFQNDDGFDLFVPIKKIEK